MSMLNPDNVANSSTASPFGSMGRAVGTIDKRQRHLFADLAANYRSHPAQTRASFTASAADSATATVTVKLGVIFGF